MSSFHYHIFYDGACGLCHRFVIFVLNRMKKECFIFSSQSGKTFRSIMAAYPEFSRNQIEDSIVLLDKRSGLLFTKGKAVRVILMHLKWPWCWLGLFLNCVPAILLNTLYDWMARGCLQSQKPKFEFICVYIPPGLITWNFCHLLYCLF